MDLCVFGCADTNDWLRYIKDMFTVELKEHPQWSQFDFHIRCYPIDPHNFPFQVRLGCFSGYLLYLLVYSTDFKNFTDIRRAIKSNEKVSK